MENINTNYNTVLTIAGSDSGGCAGIQADIKSISACGAFAASVITASTAQNTLGVTDIHPMPIQHIKKQLDTVLSDLQCNTVKIGMLHSADVINLVNDTLDQYNITNIVLDPVMVATSGDKLITDNALLSLKQLLPKATLITPNIPEAELLIGQNISVNNLEAAAIKLGQHFKTSVLLKGGHLNKTTDIITDILYLLDSNSTVSITNPWYVTNNTHGTGCSLSSSIATYLSLNNDLETAVTKGCEYVNLAIKKGQYKVLGQGNGPINHFGL
ncbi:bifunctional hydroxymethylpyrimidine kinase/phosphomethylpyrimidine kinase [Olleya aquimaris]|nr:bifunctional hydroxymethylpyrimidine kinase/phosphomethylpyrimidine kinase [Olleya aquimaris]